jgi:hypothetical protein
VGYVFPLDVAAQGRRNAARTGSDRVPEVGFYATVKRFRTPTSDEGFDALYQVTLVPDGFDVASLLPE